MGLLRLDPPIWLETPLGFGWAHIADVQSEEIYWTVFLENGAIVTFANERVRAGNCYTMGRWNRKGTIAATDADKDMASIISGKP